MRLKEGRFFRDEDTSSAVRSMLVNEAFARAYFADGKPVTGRRFPGTLADDTIVEVVGVVEDVLPGELDAEAQPHIYSVHGPVMPISHATTVAKTECDPAWLAPLLSDIVRQLEPHATLVRVGPSAGKISASVGEPRFATFVLVAFAVFALTLATTACTGCSPITSPSATARSVCAPHPVRRPATSCEWYSVRDSASR